MLGTLALMLTVLLGSARQPRVLPVIASTVLIMILLALGLSARIF